MQRHLMTPALLSALYITQTIRIKIDIVAEYRLILAASQTLYNKQHMV